MGVRMDQAGQDVLLWVKVVPGASADRIGGALGDRLKVRVAAAAEGGRANEAVCRLLAASISRRQSEVLIEAGAWSPEKVVRVRSIRAAQLASALGL
jgi:uncharacterized protein (TIGR00251 family)